MSACRNENMFLTMCWIVDEHLEDIKAFAAVNIELVCVKCFGTLAWRIALVFISHTEIYPMKKKTYCLGYRHPVKT